MQHYVCSNSLLASRPLQERASALQQRYEQEMAAIEAAARAQRERERAEAQGEVDRAVAKASDLASRLAAEGERAAEAQRVAGAAQAELAAHTARAASAIEMSQRE